jgi:LysM repeat protein
MRNNFLYAVFLILSAALFVSCDRINNSNKALVERESPSYRAAMEDYRSGRLEKAIAGFEKVCRENPSNSSARFQLACLLMDFRKDFTGSYCAFREYILQMPEGEKTRLAKDRLLICEKELAKIFAKRFSSNAEGALSAVEADELRRKLKDSQASEMTLSKALEDGKKRIAELEERVKHLKELVSGGAEAEERSRDTGEIKALLDSDSSADTPPPPNDAAKVLASFDSDAQAAQPFEQIEGAKEARDKAKKQADEEAENRKAREAAAKAKIPDTYVVQEGDTLYKIAMKFYGKSSAWRRIRDANRALISNDGRVKAGQKLVMPK